MTGKNAKVTYLDSTVGPTMADLLVAYLDQLGIEYVFGVPGGAIEPLYNALARSERRSRPGAARRQKLQTKRLANLSTR